MRFSTFQAIFEKDIYLKIKIMLKFYQFFLGATLTHYLFENNQLGFNYKNPVITVFFETQYQVVFLTLKEILEYLNIHFFKAIQINDLRTECMTEIVVFLQNMATCNIELNSYANSVIWVKLLNKLHRKGNTRVDENFLFNIFKIN